MVAVIEALALYRERVTMLTQECGDRSRRRSHNFGN